MTKTEVTNFQKDLNQAIANVYKKYNLVGKRNHITYGEREISITLKCEQLATDGTHKSDPYLELRLRNYLEGIGVTDIPETIIGAKFKLFRNPETYIITGFNTRAQNYPLEFESTSTGKAYKGKGNMVIFIK